jgi:hypothetical protein
MYAESMRLSPKWAAEFRGFWDLPDEFEFDAVTPTVAVPGSQPGKVTPAQSAADYLAPTSCPTSGASTRGGSDECCRKPNSRTSGRAGPRHGRAGPLDRGRLGTPVARYLVREIGLRREHTLRCAATAL